MGFLTAAIVAGISENPSSCPGASDSAEKPEIYPYQKTIRKQEPNNYAIKILTMKI